MAGGIDEKRTAWLSKVLGVDPASPEIAALLQKLGPAQAAAPETKSTDALLDAAARTELPAADAALPDAITAFAPRFLTAVMDEPAMNSSPLQAGAPLQAQDQLATIADRLAGGVRALQDWTDLLERAQAQDEALDDAEEEDPDEIKLYEALVEKSQAAQKRTMDLLKELRSEADGLIKSRKQAR